MVGGSVAVFDAEILHFEPADGRGHPAILIAMIVDAAELATPNRWSYIRTDHF